MISLSSCVAELKMGDVKWSTLAKAFQCTKECWILSCGSKVMISSIKFSHPSNLSLVKCFKYQLLLVMIQWTCNKINSIFIMNRCFQWFEEVP